MNFVYISPHFPPNFSLFSRHLREAGATVLGIGDAPYEELSSSLHEALTEYYRVDDHENYEAMRQAVAHFAGKYGKLDAIESHQEYWLTLEARLREEFGIPGRGVEATRLIRCKSLMKVRFLEAGIPAVKGELVTDLARAKKFVQAAKYPVILKPDDGVGAAATYKFTRKEELEAFFANLPQTPYFMEKFVEGVIYSFDGLTDWDGKPVFYSSMVFSNGIMEIVAEDDNLSYYTLRDIPADLKELGLRAVEAFGIKEKFFHIEFMRERKTGKFYAMEVNNRPPGGLSVDMFNFANDIDLYREYANVMVHNRFEARWSYPFHSYFISRKNSLRYVHTSEEIQARYGSLLVAVEPIPQVFARVLGDFGYIARHENLEALQPVREFIQKQA